MEILTLSAMACAFAMLAQSAVKGGRRRRALLLGFLAFTAFALGGRAFIAETFSGGLVALLRDLGVGLIVGGLVLARHARHPRAFLIPGALLLATSGALYGMGLLVPGFGASTETTELLVELGPDDRISELRVTLDAHGAQADKAFPRITLEEDADLAQVFLVTVPANRAAALQAALAADVENVDSVEPNAEVQLVPAIAAEAELAAAESFLTNDPRVADQWGFAKSDGNALHSRLKQAKPKKVAIVAIVDTGVDRNHEDIKEVFDPSSGDRDGNGHGTHCAGIAGAATNNGLGIASYNWGGEYIKIRGYKALSDSGSGSVESVSQAIIDAAREGADVISLSLGGYAPRPPRAEVLAVNFALRRGCIVVAAAGNSNDDAARHAPANIEGVITVAALGPNLEKASFSNTNTSLKRPIAAPGVGILSLKTGGGYLPLSGTSMATPMVSGLIGMLRAFNPQLDTDQAYAILRDTGRDLRDSSRVGKGINADAAIEAALKR